VTPEPSQPRRPRPRPTRWSTVADDPLRAAIASVTCWVGDEREHGTAIAARAIDGDVVAVLDGWAGLWEVVTDVCAELEVDVRAIVRDIALGVALADAEETP
jgi:hypothetical protein